MPALKEVLERRDTRVRKTSVGLEQGALPKGWLPFELNKAVSHFETLVREHQGNSKSVLISLIREHNIPREDVRLIHDEYKRRKAQETQYHA